MTSDIEVAKRRTRVHVIDRSEIKRINIFYLRVRLLQSVTGNTRILFGLITSISTVAQAC